MGVGSDWGGGGNDRNWLVFQAGRGEDRLGGRRMQTAISYSASVGSVQMWGVTHLSSASGLSRL